MPPLSDLLDRAIGALVSDPAVGRADVVRHDNGAAEVRVYDAAGVFWSTAIVTPHGKHSVDITWRDEA